MQSIHTTLVYLMYFQKQINCIKVKYYLGIYRIRPLKTYFIYFFSQQTKYIHKIALSIELQIVLTSVGLNTPFECLKFHWFLSSGFLECLGGFVVQFWLTNLGSEGFEVQIWGWVLTHFLLNKFEVHDFWRSSSEFIIKF